MCMPGDAGLETSVKWVSCPGCSGEIGVPPHWLAHTVACPKCGAIVSISDVERVLWRPPKSENAAEPPSASKSPVPQPEQKSNRGAMVSMSGVLDVGLPILIVTFLAGLFLGVVGASVNDRALGTGSDPANLPTDQTGESLVEEQAVATIVSLGGTVKRRDVSRGGLVEAVVLDGAHVFGQLERLNSFGSLNDLSLNGCRLTESDVQAISHLKRLRVLRLNQAHVPTVALVSYLQYLPSLERLEVRGAEFRGAEYQSDVSNLARLRAVLLKCRITN